MITTVSGELPSVQCTDWCEHGHGHTNVADPAHEYCFSKERSVQLSRYPLRGCSADDRARDYLTAVLYREAGACAPHVALMRNDSVAVELSPDEAGRLSDVLADLATAAGE
jgi:hypothetical protein